MTIHKTELDTANFSINPKVEIQGLTQPDGRQIKPYASIKFVLIDSEVLLNNYLWGVAKPPLNSD